MKRQKEFDVVGLRHRLTKDQMIELSEILPVRVTVEREPKNVTDKNALAVKVASDEVKKFHGLKIGYLRAAVANEFAPAIDAGRFTIFGGWLNVIAIGDGVGSMTLEVEAKVKRKSA